MATSPVKTRRSAHESCLAVLLLDRPEQPARLVEARVVGPAVERGEALRALPAAAAAVSDAVRARGVPAHPDEERPVVAVVGRPPLLRRRHQLDEVAPERLDVEALERLGVVEVLVQRVGERRVPVQNAAGRADSATSPGSCAADPSLASGLGIAGFSLSLTLSVTSLLSSSLRGALRAAAPVDDLGLVDLVAEVVGGRQAWRRADRAVDVDHPRRRLGRSDGGGCPRPGPRSEPATRPAGCAGGGPSR